VKRLKIDTSTPQVLSIGIDVELVYSTVYRWSGVH
jgi:hypothetical protein